MIGEFISNHGKTVAIGLAVVWFILVIVCAIKAKK